MQQPSLQDVERALEFIDADLPNDDWVKVLMGIKHEFSESGYDLAESWSAKGDTYNASRFKSVWKGIRVGGGVTIATVFKFAKDEGWTPEKKELSAADKAKQQKEQQARAKARAEQEAKDEAEKAQWHEVVAEFAHQLLEQFTTPCKHNKYLTDKQVDSFGCHRFTKSLVVVFRAGFIAEIVTNGPEINAFFKSLPPKDDRDFSFLHIHQNDLVIPLIDLDRKVWNLQIINATGKKLFLKHGRKKGCFHFIGNASTAEWIALGEGYATVASVCKAMNGKWFGLVSFDAGNLPVVAKLFASRHPDKRFCICADDDKETEEEAKKRLAAGKPPKKNTGLIKAQEAAQAVNGVVAIPDFSDILAQEAA